MKLVCAIAFLMLTAGTLGADEGRHVVLVVWDGMRPDFATREYAPTLDKLAHEGVRFLHHHSVYLTSTDVNGAALATGTYPERNGLCANLEYRPAINPHQPVEMSDPATMRRGDEVSRGNYLAVRTLCELLRAAGKKVALAGRKSVVMLFDRHNDWTAASIQDTGLTAFAGAPLPAAVREQMTQKVGPPVTDRSATSAQRNDYATRALTDFLWRDGLPDFSLLWLSEPDLAQHNSGLGSPAAVAAIKATDQNLATLLRAMESRNMRDSTDIFVVSDHGFSTVRRANDVVQLLQADGFHAAKEFPETAARGDILVAGDGGSILFYVKEHDPEVVDRLVTWLQHREFAGALFTRDNHSGTFPLHAAHIDTADAADVVMSFRWFEEKNQMGAPGLIEADWNRKPGQGTHATLSPHDLHNLMVAAGPDFRRDMEDTSPTGNTDLAPTIMRLLKVSSGASFDGRVVVEALLHSGVAAPPVTKETPEAARDFADGRWTQQLQTSRVQHTTYLDEGDGAFSRK